MIQIGQEPPSIAWAWRRLDPPLRLRAAPAGFFMPRGIRWFGWLLLWRDRVWFFAAQSWPWFRTVEAAQGEMGALFGDCNRLGIYLHLREAKADGRESRPFLQLDPSSTRKAPGIMSLLAASPQLSSRNADALNMTDGM